ncbi:MAG: DUF1573 domain-containing protein [Tannerella sp.]|jgi:hypothetical protein|nr:DUF1573 domain-containing protein [Tannerella sp.]
MIKIAVFLNVFCLLILAVASCSKRDDISSKEYYLDAFDVGRIADLSDGWISGINLIPVKLDSMETSYVGYFWLNRDTLYFSDMYYFYIYSLRPDGSIISRHVGRGQGPNEVTHFDFSIPFADGYYLHSTSNQYRYFFNNQWQMENQGVVYWAWQRWGKKEFEYQVNHPDPASKNFYDEYVLSYLLPVWLNQMQQWDSTHIAVYVITGLPKLNWLDNTGHYYDYTRIIALIDVHTGEVDRILGRRSPFFLEKPNIPTMDFIGFTQAADTLFVSFFPDSAIYMIDKMEDRAIGKFGRKGRNMNTSYMSINSWAEEWEREKEDWDTYGFYTYLKYDEKRQLLFWGYQQGAHSEYDGLQIYKNHALIGDVDVPKGFYLIGYYNDQLIGAIEDKEIKELELYYYKVNFEMQQTSPDSLQDSVVLMDGNGLLVGENTIRAGTFQAGDTITCNFRFVNQGSEPVRIIDHSVSCDCSDLIYNDKDIMVNDTVVVTMIIDTTGKSVGDHSSVAVLKTTGKRRFYDVTTHYTITGE